jgi:hypothetical protein
LWKHLSLLEHPKLKPPLVDPVIENVFIQYFFVFPNSNLTLGDYYDRCGHRRNLSLGWAEAPCISS